MNKLLNQIQTEAKNLGFDLIGITSPTTPEHFNTYKDWVDDQSYGNMNYLATDKAMQLRKNPQHLLPGCKSIIIVGMRYPIIADNAPSWKKNLSGRIASYACGRDYHAFIPLLLEKLKSKIEVLLGRSINARIFCDTGPILEKDLAMQAGLGWIGKNTALVNRHFGSFFFIGELFLDVKIDYSISKEEDFCGTCTRCIQACPTQCIQDNRTIDTSRCIAYLTIENKSEIPRDIRPLMDNWTFGCDICQLVCPWNNKHLYEKMSQNEFGSINSPQFVNLLDILSYSEIQFNSNYQATPVSRAKFRGLKRNAIVAIGNSKNPAAIPSLSKALLENPDPLIRSHAAWALEQIEEKKAKTILEKALKAEKIEIVRKEITTALEKIN